VHPTTQSSVQLQTIFGGGYVQEQHGDATHHHFLTPERREIVVDFDAIIVSLRAALSLR
jgi:hypothetical protein